MFTEINDQNRSAIQALLQGPLVCLQIILDIEDVENKTNKTKLQITADIFSLLRSEDFIATLRPNLASELFQERLAQTNTMETQAQENLVGLLEAITNCEINFMQQLNTLILEQDEATKNAGIKIIAQLTDVSAQHHQQEQTYCENTYETHPRDCCCEECILAPLYYLEQGCMEVGSLLWGFAASVKSAWQNTDYNCFAPRRDNVTEPDINTAPSTSENSPTPSTPPPAIRFGLTLT